MKRKDVYKRQDLLGTTDKTADAECSDGEHLHFAALKDGKYINPQELFNPDFSSGDAEN